MSTDPDPTTTDAEESAATDPEGPTRSDAEAPAAIEPEDDTDATDPTGSVEAPGEATPCAYTDYTTGGGVPDLPATGDDAEGLEADVWAALYDVEDPEMPVSVVDLGLIYGVAVADGEARVDMTLTYSGCPAREMLTDEVRESVAGVEGVESVDLRLVWNPPWTVEMVTETGRERLQEFGLSV